MAIKITTQPSANPLTCQSHWWGFPDLPSNIKWPCRFDLETTTDGEELLTFICQIRLSDIASLDEEGKLPHEGMLWFFADLDYFLGDIESPCGGMGEWPQGTFKVIYTSEDTDLHTHEAYYMDGTPAVLPAEALVFTQTSEDDFENKMLGIPAMNDGCEDDGCGDISLLQVDEDDHWNLRFFDCGMINFLISQDALRQLDFNRVHLRLSSL